MLFEYCKNHKNELKYPFHIILEEVSFDKKYLIGRTEKDVPEIDGIIYVNLKEQNKKDGAEYKNKYIKCKIIDIKDYDLIAEIL